MTFPCFTSGGSILLFFDFAEVGDLIGIGTASAELLGRSFSAYNAFHHWVKHFEFLSDLRRYITRLWKCEDVRQEAFMSERCNMVWGTVSKADALLVNYPLHTSATWSLKSSLLLYAGKNFWKVFSFFFWRCFPFCHSVRSAAENTVAKRKKTTCTASEQCSAHFGWLTRKLKATWQTFHDFPLLLCCINTVYSSPEPALGKQS